MALVKVRGRLKTAACTLTKMLLDVFFPCHLFLLFFGISDISPQHPFFIANYCYSLYMKQMYKQSGVLVYADFMSKPSGSR